MKYEKIGNPEGKKILLLPGTCCKYTTNFDRLIPVLKADYQLICVNYTGFDNSQDTFKSMLEETKKIEDMIIQDFDGVIDLAYGSSLGGSFVGLLVERNQIIIKHAVIGSSDLDQMNKVTGYFYAKFVTAFFMKMINHPEENQKFASMLQEKMGMDLGENADAYLENYFSTLKNVRKESIFNQFYSDLITPLGKSINNPKSKIHIMYANKMGEKYLKRYYAHFFHPEIIEFNTGHEGWLYDGNLMKSEFERYMNE